MANALDRIRRRAKEILKKHPGKKYQTALKEAGREFRAGKISGVKKKRTTAKKSSGSGGRRVGSLSSSAKSEYLKELQAKLGRYMTQYEWETKASERKKILRKIAECRKLLRAFR